MTARVFPEMECCKPGRQFAGLACSANELTHCLAKECAKLPRLEDRRAYAAKVDKVVLIQLAGTEQSFRDQVVQTFARNKERVA